MSYRKPNNPEGSTEIMASELIADFQTRLNEINISYTQKFLKCAPLRGKSESLEEFKEKTKRLAEEIEEIEKEFIAETETITEDFRNRLKTICGLDTPYRGTTTGPANSDKKRIFELYLQAILWIRKRQVETMQPFYGRNQDKPGYPLSNTNTPAAPDTFLICRKR